MNEVQKKYVWLNTAGDYLKVKTIETDTGKEIDFRYTRLLGDASVLTSFPEELLELDKFLIKIEAVETRIVNLVKNNG